MNKAIFLYTMKRFAHWYTLLQVFLALAFASTFAAFVLCFNDRLMVEAVRALIFGPFTAILVGYSIVIPQVANSQLRKDGEYLSLIFTRPVSRCSYVMTKWLSGVFFILLINVLLTAMTCLILALVHTLTNIRLPENLIGYYGVCDVLCNALGYAALMVFISSMPHPWGRIMFAIIVYSALCAMTLTSAVSYLADSLALTNIARPLTALGQIILSVFTVSIDSYHIVNSAVFPLSNIVIFVSNIVLYLTLSVFIMSIREFFYAND